MARKICLILLVILACYGVKILASFTDHPKATVAEETGSADNDTDDTDFC